MHEFRSLIRVIVLLLVAAAVSRLYSQDGLRESLSLLNSAKDFSSELVGPPISTADFNSDTHLDGVLLLRDSNRFRIEVRFRFGRVSRIAFASKFSTLAISTFDVNNDGNPDVVVEEPFSHRRLFVWLNDGSGLFHAARAEDYPGESEQGSRQLTGSGEESH